MRTRIVTWGLSLFLLGLISTPSRAEENAFLKSCQHAYADEGDSAVKECISRFERKAASQDRALRDQAVDAELTEDATTKSLSAAELQTLAKRRKALSACASKYGISLLRGECLMQWIRDGQQDYPVPSAGGAEICAKYSALADENKCFLRWDLAGRPSSWIDDPNASRF